MRPDLGGLTVRTIVGFLLKQEHVATSHLLSETLVCVRDAEHELAKHGSFCPECGGATQMDKHEAQEWNPGFSASVATLGDMTGDKLWAVLWREGTASVGRSPTPCSLYDPRLFVSSETPAPAAHVFGFIHAHYGGSLQGGPTEAYPFEHLVSLEANKQAKDVMDFRAQLGFDQTTHPMGVYTTVRVRGKLS